MAELILKVTPEEVRTKAGQIEGKANELQNFMAEIETIVNSLPTGAWNSASGRTYQEQFQSVTRNINNSLDTLRQHITNLKDAASKYEELESSQRTAASSLSTDNIF